MTALPPRELQLLVAVGAHLRVRGLAPTYGELADLLGLPYPAAVSWALARLRVKGLLSPASDRSNRGAGRAVFLSDAGVAALEELTGETFADVLRVSAPSRRAEGNDAWHALGAE